MKIYEGFSLTRPLGVTTTRWLLFAFQYTQCQGENLTWKLKRPTHLLKNLMEVSEILIKRENY